MSYCTGLQGKRCSCGEWHEVDDFDPSKPNVLVSAVIYDAALIALIVAVFAFIGAAPYLFD